MSKATLNFVFAHKWFFQVSNVIAEPPAVEVQKITLYICDAASDDVEDMRPLLDNTKSDSLPYHSFARFTKFYTAPLNYFHVKDMTDDWSSRSPPDLLTFIPYTWNFKLIVKVEHSGTI